MWCFLSKTLRISRQWLQSIELSYSPLSGCLQLASSQEAILNSSPASLPKGYWASVYTLPETENLQILKAVYSLIHQLFLLESVFLSFQNKDGRKWWSITNYWCLLLLLLFSHFFLYLVFFKANMRKEWKWFDHLTHFVTFALFISLPNSSLFSPKVRVNSIPNITSTIVF